MGRTKRESTVLVDGCEITHVLFDFSIDEGAVFGDQTAINLKVWPEKLTISGELGEVTKRHLLAYHRDRIGRREASYRGLVMDGDYARKRSNS